MRHLQDIIKGYCDGCDMISNVTGRCIVWMDVCKRTGADRGGHIGCPFSPMEKPKEKLTHKRVGQQKQKKRG